MRANVYEANCPSRQILDRIGDTWSVLVVVMLAEGTHRYTELAKRIESLRGLERDGLITRTVHPVVPPRVDYALTELGHSLYGLVEGLEKWAETHIDDVQTARAAYDAATA